MLATLVVVGLCSVGGGTAAAQTCSAEVDGWGEVSTNPESQWVEAIGGIFGDNCSGYTTRIEAWLWGVDGTRYCSRGTFNATLGSCVAQGPGSAVSAELKYACGLWDGHARGFLITNATGEWGDGVDDPFGGMDAGNCLAQGECQDPYDPQCGSSPILIPLTAIQAIRLTSAADGVLFDLNADGVAERTGWTRGDARVAFLAIDRNGNGRIDDGAELFGDHTLPGQPNGFAALSAMNQALGAPKKGRIMAGDPIYDRLLLWEDVNHNGESEPEELRPAKEILTVIGVGYSIEQRRDGHGNQFKFKGWAELRTAGPGQKAATDPIDHRGRLRTIYDVVFVR